uniref:JmjC domain-containing protein n=1 Tax=Angiostrongylus cantonensis TaxID=6313 RepID=A0A158P9E9_ANGCA
LFITIFRKDHPPHIPTGPAGFEVFTFYPTIEEFRDFKGYIQKIEDVGAHRRSGICKVCSCQDLSRALVSTILPKRDEWQVVAPEGWTARPSKIQFDYTDDQSMTGAEFRKLAESSKHRNPRANLRGKDIELYYFENMSTRHPIYGADTEGSFYDEDVVEFNMKQLGTILDDTKNVIKGVNSVYLYFGMYGASFAWHYWFAVPPEASARFERLMRQQFPAYDRQCKAFIRHKNFIVLPSLLDLHKIPYGTMTQYPNEFIITFPHGYHMGFNLGYNIAESTNFATDRWIDFGKNAMLCMILTGQEKAALWSNQSTNFSAEKTFNQSIARLWPHCAVCQYFQPLHITTSSIDVPQRSARLAFGLCFAKDERRLPIVDLSEDVLVTCSNCCVSVHPSCYGGDSWRCFRCRGRNEIAIRGTSCHLCELRGGALVPCRAGADICAYVHTACAIFNRRTVFNDATNPSCCYTHPPPKQASIDGIFRFTANICRGNMFLQWVMITNPHVTSVICVDIVVKDL